MVRPKPAAAENGLLPDRLPNLLLALLFGLIPSHAVAPLLLVLLVVLLDVGAAVDMGMGCGGCRAGVGCCSSCNCSCSCCVEIACAAWLSLLSC